MCVRRKTIKDSKKETVNMKMINKIYILVEVTSSGEQL